jgi:hypothetical protein
MIYLIITTSLSNRHGIQNFVERKQQYSIAITESLRHLPAGIQPIIVENNGLRSTFLDDITHQGEKVPIVYTNNNQFPSKSKGVNEAMDIKEVIQKMNIQDDDMIIKLTGRYRIMSSVFLEEVLQKEKEYDAFVKFFGTCSLQYEQFDCILGCYAIRAKFMKLFQPLSIDNYPSAEIAFARYVRFCGAKLKEMKEIGLECVFAEDNRILRV